MLYLTYKTLGITTSQLTRMRVCAWAQVHMHACVRSWRRYVANWQSCFEGSMWVISWQRVWCRGVARTPLLSPFIKSQLWPQGDARVSPSQAGHKQATNIFKHKLSNTCSDTLHNPQLQKSSKCPFLQQTRTVPCKLPEEKSDPWLDQASWKNVISCYPLALKDLRLAQQHYCPSILVSWSATEEQESSSTAV